MTNGSPIPVTGREHLSKNIIIRRMHIYPMIFEEKLTNEIVNAAKRQKVR